MEINDNGTLVDNQTNQDLTSLTIEAARLLAATLKNIESDASQNQDLRSRIAEQREKLEKELDSEAPSILKLKSAIEAVKDLEEICGLFNNGSNSLR